MMVKICGITNQEDAVAAVEAGATALGFNFYLKSPRHITSQQASDIGRALNVVRVGVFVDEDPARILEIAREAGLDVAQLHGAEPASTSLPGIEVWKAFRVTGDWTPVQANRYEVNAILLDGPAPGTGQGFDWTKARCLRHKLVLAGGLDEWNVAEAIRQTSPWGVDACSRLEKSPGIKDHDKVRRFITAAKAENR